MATTGFAADFARRPTSQKVLIFAVIALVLGALYYQFSYSKVRRDAKAAEDRRAELVASEASIGKDEKEADSIDKQLTALKTTIDTSGALPTAAELPQIFDMLNRKVGEAGVEVGKWDYQDQIPVDDTIDKVPIEIEVHGSFYQLEKFFYLLYKVSQKEGDATPGQTPPTTPPPAGADAQQDRIVTVENLHIGDPQVKNNQLVLTATFRASTFRKEEPPPDDATPAKPGAPGAKPAPGAGSASGSGSASGTGSAAPAGMLGLPAKEKAKVEDAIDQDNTRARSGAGGDGAEQGQGSASGADRVKGGM